MGSFNTTCCVSRSTIKPSDEVMVFPVIQAATYKKIALEVPVHETLVKEMGFEPKKDLAQYGVSNSTCYPVAFWSPVSTPLHCTYEDYGNFEMLDSKHNRVVFSEFLNTLIDRAAVTLGGENEYHDLPFDINAILKEAEFDVSYCLTAEIEKLNEVFHEIQQVVSEHRVFISSIYNGDYFPLQFSTIAKAAYDELILLAGKGKSWDGEKLDQQSVFNRGLSLIRPAVKRDGKDKELMEALDFLRNDGFLRGIRMGELEGVQYFGERAAVSEFTRSYQTGKLSAEEFFKKFKPYLDVRYALTGMLILNAKFMPQEYAGQDYDNEIGRNFAKFAQRVAKKLAVDDEE